jgi:hypothetical protein
MKDGFVNAVRLLMIPEEKPIRFLLIHVYGIVLADGHGKMVLYCFSIFDDMCNALSTDQGKHRIP